MRLIQEVDSAVTEFVHQDEATVLLVRSHDGELAPVVHCLQGLDASMEHVLFVDVTPVGNDLLAYVETVLAALFKEAQELQDAQLEDELPPFPPFPEHVYQRNIQPMVRLRIAFAHVVTQWLPQDDSHLVVALLPSEIYNRELQAHIVGWLLPQTGFEPWMARTRFILRDDKANPFAVETARGARLPGVVYFDTHLTPADHAQALLDDAGNPELPSGQRMNALLQCAMAEVSLGLLPQAMAKFAHLYEHYAAHGIYHLEALVLLQVAEAFRKVNSMGPARNCLLGALDLATKNSDVALMATSAHSLAVLAAAQRELPEVEQACEVGIGASMLIGLHDLHVDFLLRLGDARATAGNWAGALISWIEGAKVAREHQGQEMLVQILGRLQDYAARAGHSDTARQYAAEIVQIRAEGSQ